MRIQGPKLFPTIVALTFLGTIAVPAHCLQCRFKIATYTYDLCPLLFTFDSSLSPIPSSSRRIIIYKDTFTPPTLIRNTYAIDLGGEGLKSDPTLSEAKQCPDGTWICLQISNTRPSQPLEPHHIVQVIPVSGNIKEPILIDGSPRLLGVNATARLVTPTVTNEQTIPVVEITLNGGWYSSRPQRAVISFLCDETITEPSTPVPKLFSPDSSSPSSPLPLDEVSDPLQTDSHCFTWNTKHACPIAQDEKPPDPSRTAKSPSESPHTGKGSQGDEGNISPEVPLTDKGGMPQVNMVKAAGIFIGSLMTFVVCYEIYVTHLHRRKRYLTLSRGDTLPARLPSLGTIIRSFFSQRFSLFRSSRRLQFHTLFGLRLGTTYDPLVAEEYEIQGEDEDDAVVDFQRQGLLQGRKTSPASDNGYGSVRRS